MRSTPQKVLLLLLRNLIMDPHPLYSLSEWARSVLPDLIEFDETELEQLNDDRIGRALDRLFDADRLTFLSVLLSVSSLLSQRELHASLPHNSENF